MTPEERALKMWETDCPHAVLAATQDECLTCIADQIREAIAEALEDVRSDWTRDIHDMSCAPVGNDGRRGYHSEACITRRAAWRKP